MLTATPRQDRQVNPALKPQTHSRHPANHHRVRENRQRYVHGPLEAGVKWLDAHNGAITAIATVVIMIATIVNVIYVGGQLSEMKSGGEQTDQLIKSNADLAAAAKSQADATVKQADVSASQLSIMQSELGEMQAGSSDTKNLVSAALKQADAAKRQADALRGNVRADLIQFQPVFKPDKSPGQEPQVLGWYLNPGWTNVGGTDVRNFVGWWRLDYFDLSVPSPIDAIFNLSCPDLDTPIRRQNPLVLSPGSSDMQGAAFLPIEKAQEASGQTPSRGYNASGK
jgi:hypothetical protein